ncbi:MAG: DUF5830 family protein [Methanobacteriota archaeon]
MKEEQGLKVRQALQLLSMLKGKETTVKEAVALIELVTSVPELVKEILRTAEESGLIKREKSKLILNFSTTNFEFESKVKKVKCESTCRRCGKKITNCYFIVLQDSELGPFGSECVRKLRLI